ncbi:chemotaxis protein CheB [Hymenobacter sp. YC55]|uniref:chemotaxis protein CheB n=1 Tax=Hymenobacter sp. YC55 TaxID=3034019 RepID=UPI0023F7DBA7|nr:chemotaxis protein CheB [Hymenobacter sp. YC55]MDF7815256.1 chemotaxis protein CheB [Hymenobacter sp. YC55]
MEKRNIIVIGASTGGFEALKHLIGLLPADLNAAIFIVWHMSPDVTGILPQVLNRQKTLLATTAVDNEPLSYNRIYVAPPDRHLLLEQGFVRVTKGPKENRFRPAVDPLFRSAAYIYGPRVIGIVLSGALDDGTAGLWTIKNRGGLALVQEPAEAEVPAMPENALAAVAVDYRVCIADMAPLLVHLITETVTKAGEIAMEEQQKTAIETGIAAQDRGLEQGILGLGKPSPYACPDCHGVLLTITDGELVRYRCHTGHAYSADSLLSTITEHVEDTLWNAIRGVEESILLLNNLGDHYAEKNQPKLAAMCFQKAKEAKGRAETVRQAVFTHEQLTTSRLRQQAAEESGA